MEGDRRQGEGAWGEEEGKVQRGTRGLEKRSRRNASTKAKMQGMERRMLRRRRGEREGRLRERERERDAEVGEDIGRDDDEKTYRVSEGDTV